MFQFPEFASNPYVFKVRYLITMLGNHSGTVLTAKGLRTARCISTDGLAPSQGKSLARLLVYQNDFPSI